MSELKEDVRKAVRNSYGKIAKGKTCCQPTGTTTDIAKKIGYAEEELKAVPEATNLSLGCGNPIALASLKEGETVLDLGSGAGLDCFLAAKRVGNRGKVIGVDMTPEMIDKARENAKKGKHQNVEFRLGEIENLPAADNSVDVVISNCVINLAPDKGRVFKEAFRVLKPGGRLMISDIALLKKLPDPIKSSVEAYVGCLAGAIMKEEYLATIRAAGFQKTEILSEASLSNVLSDMADNPEIKAITEDLRITPEELKTLADSGVSISVSGIKPKYTD